MSNTISLPSTSHKAAEATSSDVNESIRLDTERRIHQAAAGGPAAMDRRLHELDHEWDIERTLEVNASTVSIAGIILGATVDKRFLLLPAAVAGFLLQHALQGWCPPLPLFRRLGVRTAREINQERFALKALRGDFEDVTPRTGDGQSALVDAALKAVRR